MGSRVIKATVTSGSNTKIRLLKTAVRNVDVRAEDAE